MTCWRIGWRRSGLLSKAFEFSARAGLRSAYAIRDFLARNQAPYQWIDVETADKDAEVRRLVEAVGAEAVQLADGALPGWHHLWRPRAPAQLAEKLGLRVRPEMAFYDLVIVGGGPAGLAAAVYGASEGLQHGADRNGSAGRSGGDELAH